METLNAPAPHNFDPDDVENEHVEPKDPWGNATHGHPDHSGDLVPLPHMSPTEERQAFNNIVQEFQRTDTTPRFDTNGNLVAAPAQPSHDTYQPRHQLVTDGYQGRHQRLNDAEFTPTPVSDTERRNQANLQATLALRETLSKNEPVLLQEAKNAVPGPPTEVFAAVEQPTAQQLTEQATPAERPANYRTRHRLLGRLARLFSR